MAACFARSVLLQLLLVSSAQGCKPGPGWVMPTASEQAGHAGIVVVAVAHAVPAESFPPGLTMNVTVERYLKGCGPAQLELSGFDSRPACSVDPPAENERFLAFACATCINSASLNGFDIHTGTASMRDLEEVRRALGLSGDGTPPDSCNPYLEEPSACTEPEERPSTSVAYAPLPLFVSIMARVMAFAMQ
eukprot:gb/GFBE01024388.1/.p1 GENE.gb/GFBE01024388.1/~~gb/GFBE01024388.1/.p1  ORF type:complete len:191 (+),score=34.33 gb/GFBE01024388.1/:1-573(+)